jgi:VanZ family protein
MAQEDSEPTVKGCKQGENQLPIAARLVSNNMESRLVRRIYARAVRRLFQVAAWSLLLAIIVLSVVPSYYRPVTSAPHYVEHAAIFLVTGLAFGLGYEGRHLFQVIALVAFSGTIEVIQLAIPGRHGRLSDFIVDALSVSLGIGCAALVVGKTQRIDPHT